MPALAHDFRYKVECSEKFFLNEDPEFVAHAKHFIGEVIGEAISKLKSINPDLATHFENQLRTRELTFTCKPTPAGIAALKKGLLDVKLFLGTVAYQILIRYNEELKSGQIQLLGSEKFESGIQFNKNVLFHELLHFAKVDNNPTKVHNRIYKYEHGPELDSVYACAHLVFPADTNQEYHLDTALALKTCQGIKP